MATALITGATAGIGRAFAEKLAREGYDLVLVARDEQRLREVSAEITGLYGVACEVLAADLTDREQLARVERRFAEGPIEVLVNNAGFGQKKPFWANTIEQEERQLDLLVRVVLRLTHAAVRPMIERGSGAVVNVSSVAGFMARGTYSAHKSWVTNFSSGLAIELHAKGVAVMALCPGFVHTEFHQRMGMEKTIVPSFLWLDATDLVEAAWSDLMRGKSVSVPSWRYKAVVAGVRFVPRTLIARASTIGLDGRRR
ncbi:short-chain dehydrogenase/reductase SDR [Kribbella flavida DSM 17836]|uniref:Short-chain dehydrogenase/reductase SDR n=1 Tax=Kribbella flavida (strain DSM 17836 / JCM 10339 / NBRC 14399) TaxID=479435 RepID=D2Q139_KRIFD|nr:SDR family oxidoreductase [Kribbella flavida]ADB35740.1 short-chain dehydrogenase/reductase SDR [Kribbella flavida DSM 17836]